MNQKEVLARELNRAGRGAKIVSVPDNCRLTKLSRLNLEKEIRASVKANDAMEINSIINANEMI